MSTPTLNLDELERLALAATQGDWYVDQWHGHRPEGHGWAANMCVMSNDSSVCMTMSDNGKKVAETTAYIAAANPAVVQELVAAARHRDLLKRVVESMLTMMDCGDETGAGSEWHRQATDALNGFDSAPLPFDDDLQVEREPWPCDRQQPFCRLCDNDLCGGGGVYQGRECDGIPF